VAEKPPRAYKERERTTVKKPTIKQRTLKAIVLKLGPDRLADPEIEPGWIKKKIGKKNLM